MSKTVPLQEDIHALIIDKQKELKRKRNITVRISDLLAMYVKHSIEKTEKLLGLKEDENADVVNGIKQNVGDSIKQNVGDSIKQNGGDETKQNGGDETKQNGGDNMRQNNQ